MALPDQPHPPLQSQGPIYQEWEGVEPEPQLLREKPGLCMDLNHHLSGAPSPPLQAVLFEWLIASALIQSLELHQKAGKVKRWRINVQGLFPFLWTEPS